MPMKKTRKYIVSSLVLVMIFSSVVSSSYAANNGKGNSKGKNTQEQRGEKYERYEGCANFS